MCDELYNFWDGLVSVMNGTTTWYKHNRGGGGGYNIGKLPIILEPYKRLFQILIFSVKPKHIFLVVLNFGGIFNVTVR